MTHSTLPMWKDKRNVTITYTNLPPDSAGVVKIDDLVSYQGLGSDKVKTICGIDTPSPGRLFIEKGVSIADFIREPRCLGLEGERVVDDC